ncbi:MAG: DUF6636 domain-containing protein [Actinomycetota bacterium]|nr:DUF6636 domain-containing protein [Actinomycetota bacterium]
MTRGILMLALLGVLAGCSVTENRATPAPSTVVPSAKAGFGGPTPTPAPAEEVEESKFRTPTQNIACVLTDSDVRCDIVRKKWSAPSKPSDCSLDWGNGMAVSDGKATFTCAGDTVVGTSTSTLKYGRAVRSGTVRCDSVHTGLTCKDEETGHGFTLASGKYELF